MGSADRDGHFPHCSVDGASRFDEKNCIRKQHKGGSDDRQMA